MQVKMQSLTTATNSIISMFALVVPRKEEKKERWELVESSYDYKQKEDDFFLIVINIIPNPT